jgi:ribosomal protein S18 acetylase RimI-like enzyme
MYCRFSYILSNMQNILIREAQLQDVDAISTIHVKTWQSTYKDQLPEDFLESLSIPKRKEVWTNTLLKPQKNNKVLVAEMDKTIVGFCSLGQCRDKDINKPVGEIYAIYLDQNYFGKGIGSILMKDALRLLKNNGFSQTTLWVLTSNIQARRFYEKHGWKSDGKVKIDKRENVELHESRYRITL